MSTCLVEREPQLRMGGFDVHGAGVVQDCRGGGGEEEGDKEQPLLVRLCTEHGAMHVVCHITRTHAPRESLMGLTGRSSRRRAMSSV